jgi:hypothetical protein
MSYFTIQHPIGFDMTSYRSGKEYLSICKRLHPQGARLNAAARHRKNGFQVLQSTLIPAWRIFFPGESFKPCLQNERKIILNFWPNSD